MKHTRFLAFAFLFFSVTHHSLAQTNTPIPYINSSEIIEKGTAANDSGNYKKALSYYDQIPEGDPNYLLALYEKSLSNINDSNYNEGIELAKKALAAGSPDKRLLLLNWANALAHQNKEAEALQMYDSVAGLYPLDNRPYFEKAVIKYKAKDYTGAEALLQQSLMLNPRYFRSHFLLGSTYMLEGKLSESIMALSAALLCTADYSLAKNPISVLSNIANQNDDVVEMYSSRKTQGRDPFYDEIDEIVHAKLALNKGYQLKSTLDDAIFRQLQVVMEKLQYDASDTTFSMQFYVPLYARLYKEGQFEPFILQLFSNYGFKSIDKLNDSHKGKARLDAVNDIIYPYLDKVFNTGILNYNDRLKAVEKYHAEPKDNTIIAGVFSDEKQEKFAAGKVALYKNQVLTAIGNYDAKNQKEGVWKYYYPSGKIRMVQETKNGKVINTDTAWYENGVVKSYSKHNEEGIETETHEFTYSGQLDNISILKGKDEYEFTYYHPSGTILSKQVYVNNKIKDGTYIVYFENGQKEKEFTKKANAFNGPYIIYFDNGQIKESYSYVNDKLEGSYKSFYKNGSPDEAYNFVADKRQGESVDYRKNGTIASKTNYNKGKVDGDGYFYNRQGQQYGTITYKNDRIVQTKFLKPDGTEVIEKASDNGGLITIYNEYGVPVQKLRMDNEGKMQGKSTYYYAWGGLKEETNYLNDLKNGAYTAYYENGKINIERQYKNDTADGYYICRNETGKTTSEGWLVDNESQGTWHNYASNGLLESDFYMLDDEMNGSYKNYEINGKLEYINHYDKGMITGLTEYDTTGKIIQDVTFDKGNGKYQLHNQNGSINLECDLKYGKLNGPFVTYGGNKQLLAKGAYINGEYNGDFETYYFNGNLQSKGTYVNGKKEKSWTSYTIDGHIDGVTQYSENNMNGIDSSFIGGMLNAVGNYHNDDADSTTVLYGDNGKRAGVVYYDLGTVIGYNYEDKDGNLLPMKPITNGSGHLQTTYSNGNKALDWTWDKNLLQGKQLSYYSNGQLQEESNYEHGLRNGAYNQFNPDGSKLYEANYKDGYKRGICKTYNNKGNLIFVVNFTDGQMNGSATYTDAQGKTYNYWYYYGSLEQ